MRRTGRTTRIVDFAVQQLMENGVVIVHDHADYNHTYSMSDFLFKQIRKRLNVTFTYEMTNFKLVCTNRINACTESTRITCLQLELVPKTKEDFKL